MNSPQAPTVLTHLKEFTAADHTAIEKSIDWEHRFATRSGYAKFLRRWRAFYYRAEAELEHQPWPEAGFDFEGRRKTGWLERDLDALGEHWSGDGFSPAIPHPQSLAEAIGACYVLEGATLGGQFIARQLQGLGITPATGGAFYAGYGPATGERWAEFRAMAVRFCATPERTQAAVAGAKAMFAALDRWTMEMGPAETLSDGASRAV